MAFLSCLPCFAKHEEEVTELDYRHCSLDDVPNDIFAYERTLEVLHLDSNNIRDLPRPLFHCHGLRRLGLADNDLGALPPALASLTQLVALDVSKNVLTDLPETIKQCKQLAIIEASVNPLQKIPEGCTQLVSLTELYLNDCFLEYLPANFGRLAKLRILELRDNSLTSLPKSMARLVNIVRLDLSQNQFSEVPDVVAAMALLEELWLDGNKLHALPNFVGAFQALRHLDVSFNHLEEITPELGNCTALQDLTLSSNDLKLLPNTLDRLSNLVTLKVDDNQLEELPNSLGRMSNLEELFLAENFLTSLPPSIGWLRCLHTLNVDENDLEDLPPEVGSCKRLKILSAHGNKLTSLPAELGHIVNLAVLNLAGNAVPHLPVSFVKLKAITAIWLANNQTKPLVQLNHDIDPYTGQKVLTNFLLPQQTDDDRDNDNNSESGSFHASVWEEERSKRSLVKWAGEEALDLEKTGNLRRAPTPFPKEMRAMAKKAMSLREKSRAEEVVKEGPGRGRRGKAGEHKGRGSRQRTARQELVEHQQKGPGDGTLGAETSVDQGGLNGQLVHQQHVEDQGVVPGQSLTAASHPPSWPSESRRSPDKVSRDSGVTSPSDGGSVTTDCSEQAPDSLESQHTATHVLSVHSTPSSGLTVHAAPQTTGTPRRPSDPLPHAPHVGGQAPAHVASTPRQQQQQQPVKAELVTTELDDEPPRQQQQAPPPYHIAAARSKQASTFSALHSTTSTGNSHTSGNVNSNPNSHVNSPQRKTNGGHQVEEDQEHYYENQESMRQRKAAGAGSGLSLERKASFLSDGTFDSISESETSTAPSSLQTIVRAPYSLGGLSQYGALSECDSDQDTQGTASPDDGIDSMSQLQSAQNNKLDDALGLNSTSNRLAQSQLDQQEGHGLTSASALRKVSEQLLSTSRTRASLSAPLTPRPLAPAPEARPSSIALPPGALARQPGPPSLGHSSSSSSQGSSRPPSQLSRPSSTQPTRVLSSSPSTAPPSRLPSFSPSPSSQLPNFPSTHVPQHPPRLSSPTPNPPHHVNGSLPASKTVPPSHIPSFPPTVSQTSSTTSRLPASAHNTLGLPSPAPQTRNPVNKSSSPSVPNAPYSPALAIPSRLPRLNSEAAMGYPEGNGLLSTISQAAISDDESPPATLTTHPPKLNTAALARPPSSRLPTTMDKDEMNAQVLPNYENVEGSRGNRQAASPSPSMMTQGQYRAAASQAKVATIPEGDSHNSPTNNITNNNLALRNANSKAANGMASPSARVNKSPMVTGSPSYIPMMGSRSSQRTPLATSSPSQIPTFQR